MITLIFVLFFVICAAGAISYLYDNALVDKTLSILVIGALIALAGLRTIGADQDSIGYLLYYNLDDVRMALAAEPTFVYISSIARTVFRTDGFRAVLIFYAVIGVILKFTAIRKLTKLFWLSVITYFSSYYLLHEFTQIRAGVASALILISIIFIYQKRLIPFILIIGLASLFHYSALVILPLYFLRPSLSRPIKIAIAIAIPVAIVIKSAGISLLYVIPIGLIESKIDTYTSSSAYAITVINVFNLVYLIKYVLLYVFLIFSESIEKESKYFAIMIQMYALAMFSYIALSYNASFSIRISELFGVVEIVMIPTLYYATKVKPLAVVAIVAIAFGNLLLNLYQTQLVQQVNW